MSVMNARSGRSQQQQCIVQCALHASIEGGAHFLDPGPPACGCGSVELRYWLCAQHLWRVACLHQDHFHVVMQAYSKAHVQRGSKWADAAMQPVTS